MSVCLYEAFEMRPDRLAFARVAAGRLPYGTELLEIGCGDGEAAKYFAERGMKVTATDIKCRCIPHEGVSFVRTDAAKLPFERESFDCVYCEAAFSSVEDKASASEEVYRVLRPDGKFILSDYVRREGSAENTAQVPSLKGACTEEEYMALFGRFRLVESKNEATFLMCLVLHLCHTFSISYEELLRSLGAERTQYGFETFIFIK